MTEWWSNISVFEKVFWYFAIPFSTLFTIQTILTFVGMGGDGDIDIDDGSSIGDNMDFDGDDSGLEAGGTFPIFTIRNFIIFFTVFGWTGIALLNSGVSNTVTVILSVLLGLVVMFIVAGIFYFMSHMTGSGNINIRNAIGNIGEVYLTIPPKRTGTGKVQMKIQGAIREINVMTDDNKKIPTGESVRVVNVINDSVLLVERV